MTQEHPITPPPELVQQWAHLPADWNTVAFLIAQWGADQELEACCEWINSFQNKFVHAHDLRLVRRPKPPSLKETLLARVARIPGEGADAAYLRHWVDNESQRLVDLLHEVFKSLPD
jgi:hypothetical protein